MPGTTSWVARVPPKRDSPSLMSLFLPLSLASRQLALEVFISSAVVGPDDWGAHWLGITDIEPGLGGLVLIVR